MTVCSWISDHNKIKAALTVTVVYHTEAPLITWEHLTSQSEVYEIEGQPVEGLGGLAGWTEASGDLHVRAFGKKVQISRPIAPHLEKQRALVKLALTRLHLKS